MSPATPINKIAEQLMVRYSGTTKVVLPHGTPTPPICRECKFYVKPQNNHAPANTGRCKKLQVIDVVDGSLEYEYVEVMRRHFCKGDFFER